MVERYQRAEPKPVIGGVDDGKMWEDITLDPQSKPIEVAAVLLDSYNEKWIVELMSLLGSRNARAPEDVPSSSEKMQR